MRGHYAVIAVLAIVAAGVSANEILKKVSEKKPECPLSGTARIPHPSECTLFYICQNGESMMHECPDGLHFNNVIKQCDWPPAGCVPGERWPETQPNISDEEEDNAVGCVGKCPSSDPMDKTILLPYRGDCNKFCKCSNGVAIIFSCPAGLYFNMNISVCDWPSRVKCQ